MDLGQLSTILHDADYYDFEIEILKIDVSSEPLKLEFLINDTEGSGEKMKVEMTAPGSRDFFIDWEGGFSGMSIPADHPLLWKYNDTQAELYISGKAARLEKVVFDLLQSHTSCFERYIPFDLNVVHILQTGYGLLQKGPKTLLTMFFRNLEQNGIKGSIIDTPILPENKTILFLGRNYIIADRFEFEILGDW